MSLHSTPRRLLMPVLLCLALAACGKTPGDETATDTPTSASLAVSLSKVTPREIERTVIASGPVTAWEEMQLGVEVSGLRVTSLNVRLFLSSACRCFDAVAISSAATHSPRSLRACFS